MGINSDNSIISDFEGESGVVGGNHLNEMESDAKKRIQEVKKNKKFFCSQVNIQTYPSKCLNVAKEFKDCKNCQVYFLANRLLKSSENEQGSSMQTAAKDSYNFEEYNPSNMCPLKKGGVNSVYLSDKVLYINAKAIRTFNVKDYYFVKFFYDKEKNIVCMTLSKHTSDEDENKSLKLSFRGGGDAKTSFSGFRKTFGVDINGRFEIFDYIQHSDGKLSLLTDLNERIQED